MAEKVEPVTVMLPMHPSQKMLADVAMIADATYGQTPAKMEAIGFFITGYNVMITGYLHRRANGTSEDI